MPDADRINLSDLPKPAARRLLVAAHRRGNGRDLHRPQERRAAAVRLRRPRRDGHRLRRRRLRLRGDRRHVARRHRGGARARGRVGARDGAPRALRFAHAATARRHAASTRRRRSTSPMRSRREWFELLMRESRQAGIDPRIVDWEAYLEVRTATHRLVTSAGGDVTQRYRFLFPGMAVTAHANGDTQTRSLNGYRGICQQGGDEILARFGFDGAGRRIAEEVLELVARAELPERDDGRAADARPDDPADPRVDRPSAGARPHPRRRAQLRGHELRHAGHVRHVPVRVRSPQHRVRPDAQRGARDLRLGRRRHEGREGPPHPQRHSRAAAGRRDLAGARRASRARRTRGPTAGTARRSTGWRTSTSSPATRRSTT